MEKISACVSFSIENEQQWRGTRLHHNESILTFVLESPGRRGAPSFHSRDVVALQSTTTRLKPKVISWCSQSLTQLCNHKPCESLSCDKVLAQSQQDNYVFLTLWSWELPEYEDLFQRCFVRELSRSCLCTSENLVNLLVVRFH